MSTISEAVAHMTQLIDQGCYYEQAVHDTQVAFELDQESMDLVESIYDDQMWEGIRQPEDYEVYELEVEEDAYDPLDF